MKKRYKVFGAIEMYLKGAIIFLCLFTIYYNPSNEIGTENNFGGADKIEQSDLAGDENYSPKKELIIYSPHSSSLINPVVQEFQDKYKINVRLVTGGTGELLNKLRAEQEAAVADIFWGGGADSLEANSALFSPINQNTISGIEWDKLDKKYMDSSHYWLGEASLPMVIIYNTNFLSNEQIPIGWKDLINPLYKGKIAMANPKLSGSSYTILITLLQAMKQDPDLQNWKFVEQFCENLDGKLLEHSSSVYQGVSDGSFYVGLTLEKEAVKYKEQGWPIGIVYPIEGTSVIPDAIGLVKGAKNEAEAKLFLEFILSFETQNFKANAMNCRSIRLDVKNPENLPDLNSIPLITYDFKWSTENKQEILDKWQAIIQNY